MRAESKPAASASPSSPTRAPRRSGLPPKLCSPNPPAVSQSKRWPVHSTDSARPIRPPVRSKHCYLKRVNEAPASRGLSNLRQRSELGSPVSLLDDLSQPTEKRARVRTVERAVVECEAQVADGCDAQAALIAGDHALHYAVGREDSDLRCVEHRERDPRAGRAGIRDRERTAGQVIGPQLLRPS